MQHLSHHLSRRNQPPLLLTLLCISFFLTACPAPLPPSSAAEPAPCPDPLQALYDEFPQYGGAQVKPMTTPSPRECRATFRTTDSVQQVLAYYEERLTEHGWTIQRPSHELAAAVTGRRGCFRYHVFYPQPQSNDQVAVLVSSGGTILDRLETGAGRRSTYLLCAGTGADSIRIRGAHRAGRAAPTGGAVYGFRAPGASLRRYSRDAA